VIEEDSRQGVLYPQEARLRNLTYATELYVDVVMKKIEIEHGRETVVESYDKKKVHIGRVPVMVGSKFCHLKEMTIDERVKKSRDCYFDQGGYFIINGNEKVIVAQERMSTNQVLAFKKKQPSKYTCVSEVRSQAQNSTLPPQFLQIMIRTGTRRDGGANKFVVKIPQCNEEISLRLLLLALGCKNSKQMLQRIMLETKNPVYERELIPSLECAEDTIEDQLRALEVIARRGQGVGITYEQRIEYAR